MCKILNELFLHLFQLLLSQNAVQKYFFFLNYPNYLITFAENTAKYERKDTSFHGIALALCRCGVICCELCIQFDPLHLSIDSGLSARIVWCNRMGCQREA
jgi:hypothetical protein